MRVFCFQCDAVRRTVGFDRDNPVLECGHTKPSLTGEELAERVHEGTERQIAEYEKRGYSRTESARLVTQDNIKAIRRDQKIDELEKLLPE